MTQFSKGEYSGATQHQDDLAIISKRLPVCGDDHGDSSTSATLLHGVPLTSDPITNLVSASGVIETTGDSDWFAFEAGAGQATVTLDLTPSYLGDTYAPYTRSNTDLRMQIYGPDRSDTLVASYDQASDLLYGTQSILLAKAGRYFIALTGVGDGTASDGWTPYGSLGQYKITAQFPAVQSGRKGGVGSTTPIGNGTAGGGSPSEGTAGAGPDGLTVKVRRDGVQFALRRGRGMAGGKVCIACFGIYFACGGA